MKIALFTETYLPVINGIVTHVKTLKDGLEQLGHKVMIVTADTRYKKHKLTEDILYCPALIRVKKIYNYGLASPLSAKRFQILRAFKPDIIHIHNEFGIGLSGILIAELLNVPIVYTLHTMYDDYIYYIARKRLNHLTTKLTHTYARALAHFADALTGPSSKVEDYFKKCGVKKRVEVIANSVELDKFNRDNTDMVKAQAIRNEYGFNKDDYVFTFCGRIGKEKNISRLIEDIHKTVKPDDGIKVLIIGGGPLIDQHMDEAEKYGLEDIIKFAGRVEHDDLPPYYAACNAYVTASLSDTCSISMLEGMAMNLPCLHIRDEKNAGQVVDGVNGYIYNDADEMYKHMKNLKAMPETERRKFGEQVRESILGSDSETLEKSVMEIYRAVRWQNIRKKQTSIIRRINKKRAYVMRKILKSR
jgi:1,2-diacylglycerol 3-alpha-glucosyltransferase